MRLESFFQFNKIQYDRDNELYGLVKATAPKVELKDDRKPINVIIVLDTSVSMAGNKLEQAKKSAMKFVDHLSPSDRLSIIQFDGEHLCHVGYYGFRFLTKDDRHFLDQFAGDL